MKKTLFTFLLSFLGSMVMALPKNDFKLFSPNGKLEIRVHIDEKISWSAFKDGNPILSSSKMALHIQGGEVFGNHPIILNSKQETIKEKISTPFYKRDEIMNDYQELTLHFKGNFGILFRVYNEGAAYRFFTQRKGELIIENEVAEFNFPSDYSALLPYVNDFRGKEPFFCQSFEAYYTDTHLSKMSRDTLAFLPILLSDQGQAKALISEADLEDYPGMYLSRTGSGWGCKGVFAPYPLEESQGGYKMINTIVSKRAAFIAKVQGTRSFPWRYICFPNKDIDLADNDMARKLASPNRIGDISWIKPGKVAWDWWSDWNISHVDFRAGINNETYKHYIDFAAENHLEYILIDEGWSNDSDLMETKNQIDIQELVDYGKKKNIGVILWATWYAVRQKTDEAFSHYSQLGVKGFKMDFMDRDDQVLVKSLYTISEKAAHYNLILDFHGMYKPTGLNQTYPNILNFEGVKGMENAKWDSHSDMATYEVTIPFIRMAAGPMDFTPGAMRNATKSLFTPNNSMPMSQGTRCHQMAMYTLFEAPLQMLADNPTTYRKEQECTDFLSKVPTVFDETRGIDGKVGQYIALARRKGDTWFIGAMTNWTPRDLEIPLSFLGNGHFKAEIFQDGINADRDATDYKKQVMELSSQDLIKIHLMPGGGWTARISPL